MGCICLLSSGGIISLAVALSGSVKLVNDDFKEFARNDKEILKRSCCGGAVVVVTCSRCLYMLCSPMYRPPLLKPLHLSGTV